VNEKFDKENMKAG